MNYIELPKAKKLSSFVYDRRIYEERDTLDDITRNILEDLNLNETIFLSTYCNLHSTAERPTSHIAFLKCKYSPKLARIFKNSNVIVIKTKDYLYYMLQISKGKSDIPGSFHKELVTTDALGIQDYIGNYATEALEELYSTIDTRYRELYSDISPARRSTLMGKLLEYLDEVLADVTLDVFPIIGTWLKPYYDYDIASSEQTIAVGAYIDTLMHEETVKTISKSLCTENENRIASIDKYIPAVNYSEIIEDTTQEFKEWKVTPKYITEVVSSIKNLGCVLCSKKSVHKVTSRYSRSTKIIRHIGVCSFVWEGEDKKELQVFCKEMYATIYSSIVLSDMPENITSLNLPLEIVCTKLGSGRTLVRIFFLTRFGTSSPATNVELLNSMGNKISMSTASIATFTQRLRVMYYLIFDKVIPNDRLFVNLNPGVFGPSVPKVLDLNKIALDEFWFLEGPVSIKS